LLDVFIVAFAVGVGHYKVPSTSLKINRVGMARFEEAGPVSVAARGICKRSPRMRGERGEMRGGEKGIV
jgi:hypothetical protein